MSLYRIVLSDSSFLCSLLIILVGRTPNVLPTQCSYLELSSMVLRWSDIMYFTAEISSEIKYSVYFKEPDWTVLDWTVLGYIETVIVNYLQCQPCQPGTQSDLVRSVCSSRGSNSKYQHIDSPHLPSPDLSSPIHTWRHQIVYSKSESS